MTTKASSDETLALRNTFTVVINRRIKVGRESDYKAALIEFIDYGLHCPGYLSVTIESPSPAGRHYTVVGRFIDERAWHAFTQSAEYGAWMRRLDELTDGAVQIVEKCVLEEWVRVPAEPRLAVPPKWKMAVATFIGVYPVVTGLSSTLGPALKAWPLVASCAFIAAAVVVLLTWIVMPNLSRLMRPWLYPVAPSDDLQGEFK